MGLHGGVEGALLEAVSELVGRDGYAQLTVSRLLVAAGVSRASFYQHFENTEDCFWSVYRRHAEQFVAGLETIPRGSESQVLAVVDALLASAGASPEIARLLMCEGLAAGQRGQAERDALISHIAQAMGGSTAQATIDLPLKILIGGIFRFLSMRLADGGTSQSLRDDVHQWTEAFRVSSSEASWSTKFAPKLAQREPDLLAREPWVAPKGSPRERILRATAASVRKQGYRATTVADIAVAAGVSRPGFYNEFPGKAEAFVAAYEDTFQRILAVCTPAFFLPGAWPERVWNGVQAATRLLAREPLFAYLGFVESYAIGPNFASRVHDTQLAFTMFLEDGYRQRPQAASLSRACSTLVSTTIFETGFQASRHATSLTIQRMQPLAVYLALAPFIGLDAAGEFIEDRLADERSTAAKTRTRHGVHSPLPTKTSK
jgi:AcrR family transcriptional regulator